MWWYNGSTMDGWGGGLAGVSLIGGLVMIVFWIIVIVLIIAAIRYWIAGDQHLDHHFKNSTDSALEILKERYAKGEIDKKEFDEKKKDIS